MPISPEFALAPTMHYCQRAKRKTMELTTEKRVRERVRVRARVRVCVCVCLHLRVRMRVRALRGACMPSLIVP